MAAKDKKGVLLATFNKWEFKDEFTVASKDEDDLITKLQCKICSAHLSEIRQEARRRNIKGPVLEGIVRYVDGVEYIHKTNIARHVRSGGLHDWAKQRFYQTPSTSTEPQAPVAKKKKIDEVIEGVSRVCYTHYFNTALCVVEEERPFSDFASLVNLQRKNGVTFLSGKDDNQRCKEYATCLAEAMKDDIVQILARANFFSAMMDGSQARKTGYEKELIYAKVVINGTPTELLLKCQHMADFGGEDADAVKKAFDNAFTVAFKLPAEKFQTAMVSVCTDGAAVNMGKYKGACTVKKADRNWLLVIHCANHRLELAVKDAFRSNSAFLEVDDTLVQIFYLFRNSGKAKRIITELALMMGVTCVSFVKAGGTRFQNHKYRAIKAMIINYLPLCSYLENMIANPKDCETETAAKLKGYLNRFLTFKYLASLHLYRLVLKETAHMAYVMQNLNALVTDIIDSIKQTKRRLREISESDEELPFSSTTQDDNTLTINAKGTNLPATLAFTEKNKLSDKQKKKLEKYTNVITQEYEIKRVHEGKTAVRAIKQTLIPAITTKIEERFQSFLSNEDIYASISFVDHTCWDIDDKEGEIDKIKKLSQHFEVPLKQHGFSVDRATYEFRQLKPIICEKYRHFKNKLNLWKMIFTHYGEKFPHILLLVELCLTIAVSSSTVERGFSTVGRILDDSRLSLGKNSLDDLLFMRVNISALRQLDPNYDEKLINKAIDIYLTSKRRYHKTKKPRTSATVISSVDSSFLPTPFKAAPNPLLEDEGPFAAPSSESDLESEDSLDLSSSHTELPVTDTEFIPEIILE